MKISKNKLPFVILIFAILITMLGMLGTHCWVISKNKETKFAKLSDAKQEDGKFVLKDLDIVISTRGGDSGA